MWICGHRKDRVKTIAYAYALCNKVMIAIVQICTCSHKYNVHMYRIETNVMRYQYLFQLTVQN